MGETSLTTEIISRERQKREGQGRGIELPRKDGSEGGRDCSWSQLCGSEREFERLEELVSPRTHLGFP